MKMVKNKKKAPINMGSGMENGPTEIRGVFVMQKDNSKMENYTEYTTGIMIVGKNSSRKSS